MLQTEGGGPPIVEARALAKAFGNKEVLRAVDFSIEPGAAVGLLGVNGGGKTTLLNILLGLLSADAGQVTLCGDPSDNLSVATRRRIAYVPQTPNQFNWFTGRALLRYVSAFYPAFDWPYVEGLLERWQVATSTRIGLLSPGQQQRLSIVRALATRPDLIMLDEPIASLDPPTRIAVIDELLAERRRRSLTVLFASHIVGDLARLCSHFAVLANGRITVHASSAVSSAAQLEAMVTGWIR